MDIDDTHSSVYIKEVKAINKGGLEPMDVNSEGSKKTKQSLAFPGDARMVWSLMWNEGIRYLDNRRVAPPSCILTSIPGMLPHLDRDTELLSGSAINTRGDRDKPSTCLL